MEDQKARPVPIANISVEDGVQELVRSEKMKPYLALLKAQIGGEDTAPLFATLAALPLEERYVWRVIAALKWAFCDLETENAIADIRTLSAADFNRLVEPLQLRVLQFCIFVCTMLGNEAGEQVILHSLNNAKRSSGNPDE